MPRAGGERAEPGRAPDDRIARARSAIDAGFEELIARGEAGAGSPGPAAARAVGGRPPEAGVDRGSGAQAALVDARLAVVEAALRSRIDAALDESRRICEERVRGEVEAHRRRLDEGHAVALHGAATELRRELEAERAHLRREIDAASRAGTAAAAERIEALRAAALRDAARTAEEVAADRLGTVRESLATELRRDLEVVRAEVGAGAVENRVVGLLAGLRDEQAAATAEREDELRRRVEAHLDRLAAELGARVDREIDRGLAAARAAVAETGAAALASVREDARSGIQATVAREAAKGEVRLAETGAAIEKALDERVAAALEAAEQRVAASVGETAEREVAAARAELGRAASEAAGAAAAAVDARVEGFAVDARSSLREERARLATQLRDLAAGAERALDREERIRQRTLAAEREAAARVRTAERRLADLLGRLERDRRSTA